MNEPLAQDKQELIRQIAEAAEAELDKLEKKRIQVSSPRAILKQLFEGMRNPQPAEENITTAAPLPVLPGEFPRLLASYANKTLEYIVVNNFSDWSAYHDWYTVFPPQQPASRPITISLEAEVERLRAEGAKERPKEDWKRRKELAAK